MTLRDKIRKILLIEWDPLDIADNENLHDEYDKVVNQIAANSDITEKAVAAILLNAENDYEIDPIGRERIERVSCSLITAIEGFSRNL